MIYSMRPSLFRSSYTCSCSAHLALSLHGSYAVASFRKSSKKSSKSENDKRNSLCSFNVLFNSYTHSKYREFCWAAMAVVVYRLAQAKDGRTKTVFKIAYVECHSIVVQQLAPCLLQTNFAQLLLLLLLLSMQCAISQPPQELRFISQSYKKV